jgi:hypothetical protein
MEKGGTTPSAESSLTPTTFLALAPRNVLTSGVTLARRIGLSVEHGMASILQLLTVLLQVSTVGAVIQSEQAFIRSNFEEEVRVTFRAWGSRSKFEASIDGSTLYFAENGPDGLVLKQADLSTGTVSVASRVKGDYKTVLSIPGDPRHLLVGEESAWGNRAFKAAVLELEGGVERELDFAEETFGGLIEVSPSGRYVTAWVDYYCHTGDRDCFADNLGVVSLKTGKVEYRLKQPVEQHETEEEIAAGGKPVKFTRKTPLGISLTWAERDALVLAKTSKGGASETVLRRGRDGRWRESKAKPVRIQQTSRQDLYSGGSELTVVRPSDGTQMSINPTVLFRGGLGRISLHATKDKIILVKAIAAKGWDWDGIEAVTLRWKTGAR